VEVCPRRLSVCGGGGQVYVECGRCVTRGARNLHRGVSDVHAPYYNVGVAFFKWTSSSLNVGSFGGPRE
jgi:hypothetical protein